MAGVHKPQPARTRKAVTPDQYQALLARARHDAHRDVLVVLWETGMRPQEFRLLEAGHLRAAERRVFIPAEQAKGRRHDREVLLTDAALAVLERAAATRPAGPLFRNLRGQAWTNDGLNRLFRRLSGRAGCHASAYLLRHGFATRLLKARAGVAEVAALMGHRDPTMTLKVYQHVGDDKPHLRAALNRA